MEEILFTDYFVTCHTNACGNAELKIRIPAPAENPFFICGACGNQIIDIELIGG